MTALRLEKDESESDDQGLMWNPPLNSKPVWKAEAIDFSDSTLMTSPCSSNKTASSIESREFTINFDDNHEIFVIDCDYTEAQVRNLWFTKDEYDDFLEACDDDAQKCEAHEKECRVNKLKKEIRKQRKLRRNEEKRLQRISPTDTFDESMNSLAHMEMEELIDDSDDDESDDDDAANGYNEDKEGWMCSLGLESWTLEGYKSREDHRQKAIASVLNEQYAAWDRGRVENLEMMSTLYFAASATPKHEAHKKALELEKDVGEHTVLSTLSDYNKAVQTLGVLQNSLLCIQRKAKDKEDRSDAQKHAKRRGSTGAIGSGSVVPRRGSTGNIGSASSPIIDRALSIADRPVDQAPRQPIKKLSLESSLTDSTSSHPPQTSSSSSSRKKTKQRNQIYKSKASTEIFFSPPTPPVTQKRVIVYKPSQGERPKGFSGSTGDASPKDRKIVYKPTVGGQPKDEGSRSSKSSDSGTTKKKKKKKKRDSSKSKKEKERRSKSPRPRELSSERRRSKSPRPRELSSEGRRSKSPHPRELSSERRRSKSPHATTLRPKSPSPKTNEYLAAGKLLKKTSPTSKNRKVPAKNIRPVTTSPHRNTRKEHWFFQQQKENPYTRMKQL